MTRLALALGVIIFAQTASAKDFAFNGNFGGDSNPNISVEKAERLAVSGNRAGYGKSYMLEFVMRMVSGREVTLKIKNPVVGEVLEAKLRNFAKSPYELLLDCTESRGFDANSLLIVDYTWNPNYTNGAAPGANQCVLVNISSQFE